MYAFEATNDRNETVVLDRTRTFYYLGQATNTSVTTTLDPQVNVRYYSFTSSVIPMFFVELVSGVKWALQEIVKSTSNGVNTYSLKVFITSSTSVPRIFAFGQPSVSSIGNPNDSSLVLYDEGGNIMFDGTRNCLYTPAIVDYYPPDATFGFVNGSFTNTTTRALSYTGTLPTSMAIFCPSYSHTDQERYYSSMGRFHFMTAYSGCTVVGGMPYAAWCMSAMSNAIGSQGSWIDQSNLTLHINAQVIDIARYT